MANEMKRSRKRRRAQGIPMLLMIVLLIIALVMGGLAGFAIARKADPTRAQLLKANARILELENTLTLIGFSPDTDSPEEWLSEMGGSEGDDIASELSGGYDDSEQEVWGDEDLLSGTLDEGGEPVVVAEFDGGELLSTEVIPEYNDQLTTLILSGANVDDVSDSVLNSVLHYLAGEKIIARKAAELGLDKLSDEDLKDIEAEAAEVYAEQLNYYSAFVTKPGMDEAEIQEAAAQESGVTLEDIKEELKASWPTKKFYDYTVKDVTVTDAEIQKYYRDTLAEQKESYTQNHDEYEFAHTDGELLLYNLEGYRAVRNLLIPFSSDEDAAKASGLLEQIEALDPIGDTDKIRDLQSELDPLYAPLEKTAQQVVKKLQDGEDFLSLMDAYGEDEAMLSDPARTEGYYISDDSYLFSAEFIEGSMLLEQPGDVSSPLRSSAGLHLTQYVSDVTPGEVPLESVYEQIKDAALAQKQDDYYDQATDALLDAANVKYYPERLQ